LQLGKSGSKEIQKTSIDTIVKAFQTHYFIVDSEILYLIENLGCNDIDKYLVQTVLKYSLDNEHKLHGKI